MSAAPSVEEAGCPWDGEIAEAGLALAAAEYERALALLDGIEPAPGRWPRSALRALLSRAEARMRLDDTAAALELLGRAQAVARHEACAERDRAEVLLRLGCCHFFRRDLRTAAACFDRALLVCESGVPLDPALQVEILDWRSRCAHTQGDWESARADSDRALRLAEHLDPISHGRACVRASIVAGRDRQWLVARCYAEQARDLLASAHADVEVANVLNNLGNIQFLLGETGQALLSLEQAVRLCGGRGRTLGFALQSLAEIHLQEGRAVEAETFARQARAAVEGRVEQRDELNEVQVLLVQALLAQGRLDEAEAECVAAEATWGCDGDPVRLAALQVARGDVARRCGDVERAADLYRDAAQGLRPSRG